MTDLKSIHTHILVTPGFNMLATMAFIDPFRAVNYLEGQNKFSWSLISETGGPCPASNTATLETLSLDAIKPEACDFFAVSSSWTPDKYTTPKVTSALRAVSQNSIPLIGLDTGAFILAHCGLLKGYTATVHYEHYDTFVELYPDTDASEDLYVLDRDRLTCCGGVAGMDLALQIVRQTIDPNVANAAARYTFHPQLRELGAPQNPQINEPLGQRVPDAVRHAIKAMEQNLEHPLSIEEISGSTGISQRQLNRLFKKYLNKTPIMYYRDIRLDRARGFVTQTQMSMIEIAVAAGFTNHAHFSRAYKDRFGMAPTQDRSNSHVPFEFRAWPMHRRRKSQESVENS